MSGQCIPELFADAVAKWPDRVAVTDRRRALTYAELDVAANRLANRLRRMGVGRGTMVGVRSERSVDLITGIVGVLKSGAGYVPLDPGHPEARQRFVLDDVGCEIVVGEHLAGTPARFVSLSDPMLADESDVGPDGGVRPTDPAYVIYTSGSTGQPKGVVVTHANVTRLFAVTEHEFDFGADDVWTLFHSVAFDFSVWEMWGALLYGGRLVVVPHATSRDPDRFLELLRAERVTVLNQTPTAFGGLERAVEGAGFPDTELRLVIFGGERLDPAGLRTWMAHYGTTRPMLVNMYGITETTVHVTLRRLTEADLDGAVSPIGRPLADLRVRVLDDELRPVGPGEVGEMYVGGAGVSAGYLRRPELTRRRFVPDPFGEPGDRLYRTGDLASLDAGGELVFHGRADRQVQLRGFRVELGEIEAVLLEHPLVRQATVVHREARLHCYWVGDPTARLREWLATRLPDYMVPATFTVLESMPLTANGKVDVSALPAHEAPARPEAIPARDPVERTLAEIWADLLELDTVDGHDNFFTLGGDSILAIRFVADAKAAGLSVSVEDLFPAPTLAQLAEVCRGRRSPAPSPESRDERLALPERYLAALPGEVETAYPASALQQGIIFHSRFSADPTLYHDLVAVRIAGRFEMSALRRALDVATRRHEILRTAFDLGGHRRVVQLVHREVTIPVTVHEMPNGDPSAALRQWWHTEWQRGLDLTRAPLARCHVLRHDDGTFHLAVAAHHAILDGWSFATLLTELLVDYDRELSGVGTRPARREPPPYRHFVELEERETESARARRFWQAELAGARKGELPEAIDSATDSGPAVDPDVRTTLPDDLVRRAEETADSLGVPARSVYLAAHLAALAQLTGHDDVVTGLVVNGRPEVAGGETALGTFLNVVPLRVRVDGSGWTELIRSAFAAERRLSPYRRFPLAEIARATGGVPFTVFFNYASFHVFDSTAELSAVRPVDWYFSDRTEYPLTVDIGQIPPSNRWELFVRTDHDLVAPHVAGLVSELIQNALSECVYSLPGSRGNTVR